MIQLNDRAADDLETYWRGLRRDQYIVLTPSDRVTVEDALRVMGGEQLVITGEVHRLLPVG
jgi:hypothetical protein